MKKLSPVLYLFFISIFLLSSCTSQDDPVVEAPHAELFGGLPGVKKWFYKNMNSDTLSRFIGKKQKVLWEQAIVYRLENSTVYQIPIASSNPRVYNFRRKDSPQQRIEDVKKEVGFSYIVFNRFDNGGFEFSKMTVQPDKTIISAGKNSAGFRYRKMDSTFSGMVLYHSIRDEFLGGWQFENGKVVKKVKYVDKNTDGRIVSCTSVTLDWYCQECNDYYWNGNYTHSSCTAWTYCGPAAELFFCTVEEQPGEPSGGGGPMPGPTGWLPWAAAANWCPTINYFPMVKVGNSWTGQVNFVRPRFVFESTQWQNRRDVPLSYTICASIPEYGLVNAGMASEALRLLHNAAVSETLYKLSFLPQPPPPSPLIDAIVSQYFRDAFLEVMQLFHPRASVSFGPCAGQNIPQSEPVYGGSCN